MIVDKSVGKEEKGKEKRGEEKPAEKEVQKKSGFVAKAALVAGLMLGVGVGCSGNPYSAKNSDSSTDAEQLDNVGGDPSHEEDVEADVETDSMEDVLDVIDEDVVEDVVEEDVAEDTVEDVSEDTVGDTSVDPVEEDVAEEDPVLDTVEEDVSTDTIGDTSVDPGHEDVISDPVEEDVAEEDTVTDPGHEDVISDPVEEDVAEEDVTVVCSPVDQIRTVWVYNGSVAPIGGIGTKYTGVNLMGEATYDILCGTTVVRSGVVVSVGGSSTPVDVSEHGFDVTLTTYYADSTRAQTNIVVNAH